VRVTDMNDNAPYFSETVYTARVPENTDVGTIVITVTAQDLDEGIIGLMGFIIIIIIMKFLEWPKQLKLLQGPLY